MDITNKKYQDKKKRRGSVPESMIYGKIPPQAKDLEEAILGAIMMEKGAFDIVSEILKPECFYVESHIKIFKAMQSLNLKSQPIDILTVIEELRALEDLEMVGGPYYVTKLTNTVVGTANLETHCNIVYQKFVKREMIRICGETLNDAYEDSVDVFNLVDNHEKEFTGITANKRISPTLDWHLVDRYQRILNLKIQDRHITGVPSGYTDLDRVTHGWQDTDLIILAARPAVGKTAFAINLARNAALHPERPISVGLFSLEMSAGQLVDRMLSAESDLHLDNLVCGKLEEYQMKTLYVKGVQPLSKAKICIDDRGGLNVLDVKSEARRWKRLYDIKLIIIDYLQLMSGLGDQRSGNREQEISTITRNLKQLAKDLKIPIIALSQLSRKVEDRKGGLTPHMPQLSDLRESGAIEQDADLVMFMYRPEYYDIKGAEIGEQNPGETHIKIAKHRSGILETIKLTAHLRIQKFVDFQGFQAPQIPTQGWLPLANLPYKDNADDLDFTDQ